jgi:DNA-directed RNA polymerase specialized sigma24 family protein
VEDLYETHYRALVQLAALLTGHLAAAEDVVQAAFAGMHRAWRRLGTSDQALRYLRQQVVRRARSCRPGHLGADQGALAVLRGVPVRQREALVLRYLGGLPEAEIARVTGATARTVSRRLTRGLAAFAAAEPGPGDGRPVTTLPVQGSAHKSRP